MSLNLRVERLEVGYIGANCYLLIDAPACILVDPGEDSAGILAWMDGLGVWPTMIVATHGHLDHTAAIPGVLAAASQRGLAVPPVAVHASDAAYFGAQAEATNRSLFRAIRATGYFSHFWKPIPEPDRLLSAGEAIESSDFVVLHTPGHSAGSICLYDPTASILISGDTLFRDGVGRTDGPDADPEVLLESLRSLSLLPAATRVYPGHGEATTIGRELPGARA